jgi:ribosome-binding factor A
MSRSRSHRTERLAALIKESLAAAIATKVKDPRIGFATVTRVTLSPDAKHATVSVSVMGSDEEKQATFDGLMHARGFLRTHLARTVEMRSVPELHLVLDRGLEHAARIEEILGRIKHGETDS